MGTASGDVLNAGDDVPLAVVDAACFPGMEGALIVAAESQHQRHQRGHCHSPGPGGTLCSNAGGCSRWGSCSGGAEGQPVGVLLQPLLRAADSVQVHLAVPWTQLTQGLATSPRALHWLLLQGQDGAGGGRGCAGAACSQAASGATPQLQRNCCSAGGGWALQLPHVQEVRGSGGIRRQRCSMHQEEGCGAASPMGTASAHAVHAAGTSNVAASGVEGLRRKPLSSMRGQPLSTASAAPSMPPAGVGVDTAARRLQAGGLVPSAVPRPIDGLQQALLGVVLVRAGSSWATGALGAEGGLWG